jgi:hypothetical protein
MEDATQTIAPSPAKAKAKSTKSKKRDLRQDSSKARLPEDLAARLSTGTELGVREIANIDDQLKALQLETALLNLDLAREANGKHQQNKLTKQQKFERAQRVLGQQIQNQKNMKDACAHQQGGFGLDDMYSGDGPSALAVTDLPLKGRQFIVCGRCLGDWTTPDPNLKKTDPELYVEQMLEFKQILLKVRNSKARAIGVPTVTFETMDGMPVHPVIR